MNDFIDIINKAEVIYGEDAIFELIVKYSGNVLEISKNEDIKIEILSSSFAIFTLPIKKMVNLIPYPQIDYVEIPKKLILAKTGILDGYYKEPYICDVYSEGLTGKGVIVAILDTGINYEHLDFRNEDGTTRLLYLWDQTVGNKPPEGFYEGIVYTKSEIDIALKENAELLSVDTMGHGTMVSGICVGNGNRSNGAYKGVAPNADIITVKLGKNGYESYAMTTEFMRAIKFSYDMAKKENKPLVLNASYGTNSGSHNGTTLFEEYIDDMISTYPSAFIVPTGNEGEADSHYENVLMDNEVDNIDFTVSGNLKSVNFSIWKDFVDDFTIEIITPDNNSTGILKPSRKVYKFSFPKYVISVVFNEPTPYKIEQEIYVQIDFINPIAETTSWRLNVYCGVIVSGDINIWLPTVEEAGASTLFLSPSANTTLTIPSTSSGVISVSGYDTYTGKIASFSGRGFKLTEDKKPNISAPAVEVLTTSNNLLYDTATGTSFSAPFVAGACACLMEYGVVEKNVPYLYGEKLKAYLEKGATRESGMIYPNRAYGYGLLCIKNTLDLLKEDKDSLDTDAKNLAYNDFIANIIDKL